MNYNIIEHKSVGIIYYYKVGSRFLDAYFSKYNDFPSSDFLRYFIQPSVDIERDDSIKIGKYYIEPKMAPNNSMVNKILKNELVDKPILLLYRHPYEKTISGLCEDFHEEFMRDEDSVHYIDLNSFYKYIEDTNHSKVYLYFLHKICKGLNTLDTLSFISKNSDLEESYISLLKKYVEYRIGTREIGVNGHTEFHTEKTFIILNELHPNQKYQLVNLDDKEKNLGSILDTYKIHKNDMYIDKNEYSNNGYKVKLNNTLELKTQQQLYDILKKEMEFYDKLNNIANTQ